MMTLPMFLILSNFNADLASVARVSVVRVLAAEESKGWLKFLCLREAFLHPVHSHLIEK